MVKTRDIIILVCLVLLCAISVTDAVLFFRARQNLEEYKSSLGERFEKQTSDRKEFARVIEEFEASRKEVESRFRDSDELLKELSSELAGEKKRNIRLAAEAETKDKEVKRLKADTAKLEKEKRELSRRLESSAEAYGDTKAKFDRLITATKESGEKIKELNEIIGELSKEEDSTSLGTEVIKD